jgi:membrane-bound lytic murein transglycosylase A
MAKRSAMPGTERGGRRVGGLALAFLLALGGCFSAPSKKPAVSPRLPPAGSLTMELSPVTYRDLPGWSGDNHAAAVNAFLRSCAVLSRRAAAEPAGVLPQFGRVGDWQQICAAAFLITPDDRAARRFIEQSFVPYIVRSGIAEEGLFTGYYEPVLRGSWQPTALHRYPIYRQPPELNGAGRGVTLPSRVQIDAGALAGRGLELLWLDDPVDAFFLHIQGSGKVAMADGSRVRIGYAGKNGHAYFPIGRELIRRGEVPQDQMSMQAIRQWLAANPRQAPGLMALNGSYVFFRLIDGDGPIGAQGVALVPGRSIAVDPAFVPYGVPVWLDTTDPLTGGGAPLRRLVVAQDTGGAIKGPIRGDLFWGSDALAAEGAGLMKQPGRWFLLLPRSAAAIS